MRNPFWFLTDFNTTNPKTWGFRGETHLDIGCGANPRNPFGAKTLLGADILDLNSKQEPHGFTYLKASLDGSLPLPNNSIDSLSGFDFLEHLPRSPSVEENRFITFMNESFRVLKNGGVLMLVTPAFPSPAAFQDPTHVNFITEQTINYFVGKNPGARNLGYGFTGSFELITQEWVGPFSLIWDNKVEYSKTGLSKRVLLNFCSPRAMRAMISALRKPSHLLWLIKKTEFPQT